MPQVSAELRWFIGDDAPEESAAVERWFKSGKFAPGGGKDRLDVYLLDHGTAELGIKARGGKAPLEVKALVNPSRAILTLGKRTARAEVWTKVESTVLALPDDATKCCATSKRRLLRKFSGKTEVELGTDEKPITGPAPDVGCNVEWTTVTIGGRASRWHTLGFESFAFNKEDGYATLIDSLEQAIDALGPPPVLSSAWEELSYPGWLAQIARK